MENLWLIIVLSCLIDWICGDPLWFPHPVRFMGLAITKLEKPFRKVFLNPVLSGTFFALFLIAGVYFLVWFIILLGNLIFPFLGYGLEIFFIYTCLSIKSLDEAGQRVWLALEKKDISLARKRVSEIVSRNTASFGESAISRATIETLGENFVDGVLSPLFFAVLGGAPLAMAFKMVSTLDSMVGYDNETYSLFGRASARIDDLANFIPARLCLPIIAGAAQILEKTGKSSLKTGILDHGLHKSPNAGWPEAAFSGALKTRLGGPNIYNGKLVEKPFFGADFPDARPCHIQKARKLMKTASLISITPGVLICYFIWN